MKKNSHLHFVPALPASLQAGFSLIELMVSLAIGLVLILFVSSLYVSSKSSSRLQDENARLQEGGRSAMNLLGRNIKQAWFGQPVVPVKEGLVTQFAGQGFAACDGHFSNMNAFADIGCSGSGPGSALHLSYQVEGVINAAIGAGVDCNGQAVPVDPVSGRNIVVNRFYIQKPGNETNFVLYCLGNGGPVPQPVVSNVESMIVTYGIDTEDATGV
jgi:type IV pilus assembly protein PilW